MLFAMVLLTGYALTWLLPRRRVTFADRWRLALALGMTVAGVAHLVDPTPFVQHLPEWVPQREPLVLLTGLIEIGLGLALLAPQPYRRLVGLLVAAYLVAVFPGNIYVAVAGVEVDGQPGGVYPWLRLLFQPLFIWLAVWCTRPLARRNEPTGNDRAERRGDKAGVTA